MHLSHILAYNQLASERHAGERTGLPVPYIQALMLSLLLTYLGSILQVPHDFLHTWNLMNKINKAETDSENRLTAIRGEGSCGAG